jgi:hypothetical protein
MISHNKLDKSFGPVGSFSGIIVFVAGLASVWFSLFSLLLLVIGAFVGFTYSSTEIDFDRKRVRFLNNLFGILKTGEWLNVNPDMKIGISRSGRIWRTYSGGNRTLDRTTEDFRLILYDSKGKELMPLAKTKDVDSAEAELEIICKQLEINKL